MKKNILEEDLYKPIHDFFIDKGFTVRSEIQHCDIAAVKDDVLVVVEMKKNLSVKLLTQAVKRQKLADLVFIAVPKPKKFRYSRSWNDTVHLIRRLELGLIFVSFKDKNAFTEVVIEPKVFDRSKSIQMNKKKRSKLVEEFKGRNKELNVGGSKGKKLVTAYREQAIFIGCCLKRYGEMSTRDLRKIGTDDKKTSTILQRNHYEWFERVKLGVYKLTSKGEEEIFLYNELVDYYNEKLDEIDKKDKH